MTIFLLDENVLREMTAGGNANVRKWAATVSDGDLRISVMTFFEKRSGWLARLRKNPDDTDARARLAALERLEACYRGRILSTTSTPRPTKSLTLRVATTRPWMRAVAASAASIFPFCLAPSSLLHSRMTSMSTDPFHDPPRLHPASWHG